MFNVTNFGKLFQFQNGGMMNFVNDVNSIQIMNI